MICDRCLRVEVDRVGGHRRLKSSALRWRGSLGALTGCVGERRLAHAEREIVWPALAERGGTRGITDHRR